MYARTPRTLPLVLALLALTARAVPTWAGATNLPTERRAELPPDVVPASTLAGELVITVDDNPTCDSDGANVPCGDEVVQCTGQAGRATITTFRFNGRQQATRTVPKDTGRPIAVAESLVGCFPLGSFLASFAQRERLTESVLLELTANDLLFQLFPPAVASALLRELRLLSGIPVVKTVRTLSTESHVADASPSTLRASVEIEVLQ